MFYGWRMMAAAAVLRLLGGGLHSYGFTVFFLPLSHDLGLSRAATSLAFSLARAEGAIEGPAVGYLLDRFGAPPVMLIAVILTGIGYVLLSSVDSYATFLLVYLGIVSLAFSGGFMHAPMVLANSWFIRRRAQAMTLISAAFSLGGALIAPLLGLVVHAWGWRSGALSAGILFLLIGAPLCWLIRPSPESMGLLPDGDPIAGSPKPHSVGDRAVARENDWTAGQAMRSFIFWSIVIGTSVRGASYSALMAHFIPMMVWKGLPEQQAAFLLGIFAFLSMVSIFLFGWVADRINKPQLVSAIMLLSSASMLVLIFGQSVWSLWLFTILFTFVEPTYPVSWAIVGDFFGRKHFGKIRGNMSFFYMWGSVVGPVFAGAVYDRSKSYEALLWTLILLFVVAAVFYGSLMKPWKKVTRARALAG
ncbi:MAG: MFS transporter [Deltaproteobacteria bacterium]|nr:MFS transporter [Deltaproteobacteria bacterium]